MEIGKRYMKLIIYTALFAHQNTPLIEVGKFYPFNHDKKGVKYIAFTNRKDLTSDFWDVKYVDLKQSSPRVDARYYKINPHIVLPEHEVSLWMDSQVYFTYEPNAFVEYYLKNYDVAIHHHSDISSVAQESVAQAWVYQNDDPQIIMNQVVRYGKLGFPMIKYDHYSSGILFRKNNKFVEQFNNMWWDEVNNNSLRDQLSLPYVVWSCRKSGLAVNTIMEDFTAHKNALPIPKSSIFFTTPKPSLKENLTNRELH